VILGLDTGKDLGEQGLGEEIGVMVDGDWFVPHVELVDERHVTVAERHYDDHGLYFAFGEQVVEDEVGATYGGPSGVGVAPAVKEVHDRIGLPCFCIIAGRSVDVVSTLVLRKAEDSTAGIDVMVQGAVGNISLLPWLGSIAGYGELVGDVDEVNGGAGVCRIEAEVAVCLEVVVVYLRKQGLGGRGPDAGGILLHEHWFWKAVDEKFDSGGSRVFVAEGDGAVRMNLYRAEGDDGLSGQEERCGDDR